MKSYVIVSGKLILLIEDNKRVLEFNKLLLEDRGFAVETAMTLAEAWESIKRAMPDAIVLDIGMPDGSGLDFLCKFRQTSKIPILLLTGYGEDEDIVIGFESGCSDYLAKPYTFGVLLARLKRLLQGAEQMPEAISKGALIIDPLAGQAFCDGKDLLLSQKEFSLLLLFVEKEGETISAEYIYEKVWKAPILDNKRALEIAISKLRRKIALSGFEIAARRGQGYVFRQ